MSATGQSTQQLQQDIQHELTTVNQLLSLISVELKLIKKFTSPGEELELTIRKNASLISTLANLQHIDLGNIPPMVRKHNNMRITHDNQHKSYDEQNTIRNESEMDNSQ